MSLQKWNLCAYVEMRIINTTFISAFLSFIPGLLLYNADFISFSIQYCTFTTLSIVTWIDENADQIFNVNFHVRIILTFNSFTDERVHKTDKRQSSVMGITFITYYALRFGDHLFSTKKEDRHMSRMVYSLLTFTIFARKHTQ